LALLVVCGLAAAVTLAAGREAEGRGRRLLLVAGALGVLVAAVPSWAVRGGLWMGSLYFSRNFFGLVQVRSFIPDRPEKHFRGVLHGRVLHGGQRVDAAIRNRAFGYYDPSTGIGTALRALRELRAEAGKPAGLRGGVLGLGIGGSLALFGEGDAVRYYEINPAMIALAKGEGGYFHYLADSKAKLAIVEGDARVALELELAKGQVNGFDLLAGDAFSGGNVPAHVLTREAVATYLKHLAPGGVLAMHTSNNRVRLLPVVLDHAAHFELEGVRVVTGGEGGFEGDVMPSEWLLLSRDRAVLERIAALAGPRANWLDPAKGERVAWTDELNSLWPVLGMQTR
jgi:hypothetical protein